MSEIWQYWLYVFEKIRLFQLRRFHDVIRRTWYLGFTSFGGPPVHFQIVGLRCLYYFGIKLLYEAENDLMAVTVSLYVCRTTWLDR